MATVQLSLQGQGKVFVGSATLTVGTDAAAAETDYSITEANAAVGDVVLASFDDAGMETGVGIIGAWVSVAGTIKVRTSNFNASNALNGGSRTIRYALLRS